MNAQGADVLLIVFLAYAFGLCLVLAIAGAVAEWIADRERA